MLLQGRYWSVCFLCSICLFMFSRLTLQTLQSKDHEQKKFASHRKPMPRITLCRILCLSLVTSTNSLIVIKSILFGIFVIDLFCKVPISDHSQNWMLHFPIISCCYSCLDVREGPGSNWNVSENWLLLILLREMNWYQTDRIKRLAVLDLNRNQQVTLTLTVRNR